MNSKDNNVSCEFICEWFDFLRIWINHDSDDHDDEDDAGCCQGVVDFRINNTKSDQDNDEGETCCNLTNGYQHDSGHDESPRVTNVSCFNCDDNFLYFGTNTGWIYCFPRGEKQAKGPLFERHPVKCQIIGIDLPDENVVSLLLPHGFIMFNFVRNEIIYSWSIPR